MGFSIPSGVREIHSKSRKPVQIPICRCGMDKVNMILSFFRSQKMSKFGARPTKQQGLAFPPPPLGIFPKFSAQIGLCSLLPCGYKPATPYNFGQHHRGLLLGAIFLLSTCICFIFPFKGHREKLLSGFFPLRGSRQTSRAATATYVCMIGTLMIRKAIQVIWRV